MTNEQENIFWCQDMEARLMNELETAQGIIRLVSGEMAKNRYRILHMLKHLFAFEEMADQLTPAQKEKFTKEIEEILDQRNNINNTIDAA